MKSDHIKRFPAHDFLRVGFTLQTSRTNNKRVISTFKFGYHHVTLKEGPKVKSKIPKVKSKIPSPWHGGGIANAKPKYPPDASGGYNYPKTWPGNINCK